MKQKNKIPKDWQVIKLNNLFETISNLSNAREDLTDIAQKIMYIHYGDIHTNSIHEKINLQEDTLPYLLDNKIEKDINDMLLKNGDVIITDASEDYEGIAKSVEITNINNKKVVAGLHTIVLRPIKNIVSIGYGSYLLQMPITSRKLKSISQGTKVISISFQLIKDLDLFLPPLKEQEKIVEILELWDKAIETTKKLIEQKKLQKKYLMQKLLTGKIRLKGFKDRWKKYKLGDVCDFISGFSFSSNDFCDRGILLIKISNISNGKIVLSDEDVYLPIDYVYKYKQFVIKQNDLLIAMTGATTGKLAINTSNKQLLLNQRVGIIRTLKFNQNFINQYLFAFKNKFLKMSYGGAQPNISSEDIKKIIIYIPQNLTEQKAIADILSTADKQIDLLKQKLSKLELQKKGLMQKLLTGQIRVC